MRKAIIEAIMQAEFEKMKKENGPATAEEISDFGKRYLERHEFKLGDLINWKPGMKEARYPAYNEPAVVLEVIPGRRELNCGNGNNHEFAPAEIRVGVKDEDGDLVAFWVDANRFEWHHKK